MLAFFAQFDKAGDRHAGSCKAQHRMLDQPGLERCDGKAQSDAEEAKRDHVQNDHRRSSTAPSAQAVAGNTAAHSAGSRSAVK